MEPHQQRVIAERDELADKAEKLRAFINSDRFDLVDVDEKGRLLSQLAVMMKYESILRERIAAF